jgi:hypothetical protein
MVFQLSKSVTIRVPVVRTSGAIVTAAGKYMAFKLDAVHVRGIWCWGRHLIRVGIGKGVAQAPERVGLKFPKLERQSPVPALPTHNCRVMEQEIYVVLIEAFRSLSSGTPHIV